MMFYIIGHKLAAFFCVLAGFFLLVVALFSMVGISAIGRPVDPNAPFIAKAALAAVSFALIAVGFWQHQKAEQYAYERKVNKARRKADKKNFRNYDDYNEFMKRELDS